MARSNQHAQKKSSKVNGKHDGKSKGRSRFKRGGDAKASAPSAAAGEEVPARKLSSSKLSTTTRNLRFMQRGNVKDGGGAEDSNLASHPDRWVLPAASTAHTASAAAANDAESAGVARRTVEVVSGFSAFESIMETRRSFQNFNPEIEKDAQAEQKAKAKVEDKHYKMHLEQLRVEKEEDIAGSDMSKYFGDNVANAAAEMKRRSAKRKAAKGAGVSSSNVTTEDASTKSSEDSKKAKM